MSRQRYFVLCNEGIKNAEKERFPGSTLQWESKLYETGLNEEIKKTGRKEYRKVVRYLKIMKNIRGGDERVYTLLEQFLQEYKNRPAMADEFKRAFPEWLSR